MIKKYSEIKFKESLEDQVLINAKVPDINTEWEIFRIRNLNTKKRYLILIYLIPFLIIDSLYIVYLNKIQLNISGIEFNVNAKRSQPIAILDTQIIISKASTILPKLNRKKNSVLRHQLRFRSIYQEMENSDSQNMLLINPITNELFENKNYLSIRTILPYVLINSEYQNYDRIALLKLNTKEISCNSLLFSLNKEIPISKNNLLIGFEASLMYKKMIKRNFVQFGLSYFNAPIKKVNIYSSNIFYDSSSFTFTQDSSVIKTNKYFGIAVPIGYGLTINNRIQLSITYRFPLFNRIVQSTEKYTSLPSRILPTSFDTAAIISKTNSSFSVPYNSVMLTMHYSLPSVGIGLSYIYNMKNNYTTNNSIRINLNFSICCKRKSIMNCRVRRKILTN